MKPFHELAEQWAQQRLERQGRYRSPHAKRERNARMVELRKEGETFDHIAWLYGVSHSRVRYIVRNYRP